MRVQHTVGMTCPLDRSAFPVTSRYVYLDHAGVNALVRSRGRRHEPLGKASR